MKRLLLAAALFAAASAAAQPRTTQDQARTYIWSALITGAAHSIVSPDIELAPQLRERLSLPAAAPRIEIYEAIHGLMRGRLIRVRTATPQETEALAGHQGSNIVFAIEGGGIPLLMAYDLERDQVAVMGVLGAPWVEAAPEPEPAPAPPPPVVARVQRAMPTSYPSPPFLLKPVFFAHGDAALDEAALTRLEDAGLPRIALMEGLQFVVRGHSDRLEAQEYKGRLSQQRAEAVRDYLAAQGVPAANIRLIGFGASVSMTACAQRERAVLVSCLAPDRRVTVEVVKAPPM
jgi:OOP family OmpA-OmpF porin